MCKTSGNPIVRITQAPRKVVSSMGNTSTFRLPPWTALAGIMVLASVLRFAMLGSASLWFDEALVARIIQFRWQEIVPTLVSRDVQPPLYFFFMKAWAGFFGSSEIALRLPSAFASLLSVLLTYFVMRRMASEQVSLLAALLISLSPFDVMAGQEARMYAPLEMLALGSTLAVILSVERGGLLRWAIYAALAAATAYTHYLGIFVIAAHGLWMGLFERPHFRTWVLAVGSIVLLSAPWIPSLWYQYVVIEVQRTWFRHPVGSADLTGLLGLFAFGGSLFGMPGFFLGGTLDPVVEWIVVLPFLFLVWRGVSGMSSDRRSLALLSLCLALPIGMTFLISLIKPTFYARWFSFLVPFYAMFVACGIVETAKRVRAHHGALLVGLTAGALVCGVVVFAHYYFDPGFRPFQWRAAAELVRAQGQPQDAIMYVHQASEVAFRYYYHEPHPSLILNPTESLAGVAPRPGFTAAQAQEMAVRYQRVWLIASPPFDARMQQRLFPTLRTAFQLRGAHDFRGVWVFHLEAKP
jgi:mannosyltransferase